MALTLLVLAGCSSSPVPSSREPDAGRAARLFDSGEYDAARAVLEEIDAVGRAEGSELYQLYYCRNLDDDPSARLTLLRAHEALLEQYRLDRGDLQSSFYLAHASGLLQRHDQQRRVAEETIRRVDSGGLAKPEGAVGMFRLGMLHLYGGREEGARAWLTRSVEAADATELPAAYVTWASRFLASAEFDRASWVESAKYYRRLLANGRGHAGDFDRLATALLRLGRLSEAVEAWERAVYLGRRDSHRYRYRLELTARAAETGSMSPAAPDGRAWKEVSRSELFELMHRAVRDFQKAQNEASLAGKDACPALSKRASAAQRAFVSAALEYALRGHGIREAALRGGFVELIFYADEWDLQDC